MGVKKENPENPENLENLENLVNLEKFEIAITTNINKYCQL